MIPEHRAIIKENMTELIKAKNLDSIISEIQNRKLSFPDMIERITVEAQNNEEQLAKLFFEHIQRRGPNAFRVLVQTLHLTGNAQQAYLLDPESLCISVEELSKLSISTLSGRETPISYTSSPSASSLSLLSPRPTNGNHSSYNYDSDQSSEQDESKKPIKVVVKKAVLYNGGETNGCYPMFSKPRGFALIINNIQFVGFPDKLRLGAQHDSTNLELLLENFGYEVTRYTNVYKDQLLNKENGILKEFTDKFYERDVDSCFVAIMSHGDDYFYIDMVDPPIQSRPNENRVHLWDDILPWFNNEKFGIFYGKPKVFVIQACRGHQSNIGVPLVQANIRSNAHFDTSTKEVSGLKVHQVPQINHTFILQSTIPGYKAMRDKYRGSWFIECICDVFMNYAWTQSLDELYQRVAQQLEQLITLDGNMQCCDFQKVGYGHKLYFNPGLVEVEDEKIENTIEGAAALIK